MSKRVNRDDIDKFFDNNIYTPSRTLYIGSTHVEEGEETGTDAMMAANVIKGLHILESVAPAGDKPITIIMNNPGGEEDDGFAIYDAIKMCSNHVTMIIMGKAMSMGGIILQAADKRIMAPNARFMMHYGSMSISANAQDVYKWVDDNKRLDKIMEDIFLEKMKQKKPRMTRQQLKEMLKADFIVNAKEAVKLGLADEVLGQEGE